MAFSLAGTAFSKFSHLSPGPIAPAAALLTLLTGVIAVYVPMVRRIGFGPTLAAAAGVVVIGLIAELIGVRTGRPFGSYEYTNAWWPTVNLPSSGYFPLLLPLAWMLVAGASFIVAARLERYVEVTPVAYAIVGGLIAAAVDLVMEPVMTGPLGYWHWKQKGPLPGGAPLENFFAWWGVATLAGLFLAICGAHRSGPEKSAGWVLAGHVGLVVGLGLIAWY